MRSARFSSSMASDADMSGWTDLLHSSSKLIEQAAPSAQFPALQVSLVAQLLANMFCRFNISLIEFFSFVVVQTEEFGSVGGFVEEAEGKNPTNRSSFAVYCCH